MFFRKSNENTIKFKVNLACTHCEATVKGELRNIEGIKSIKASASKKLVEVTLKENSAVTVNEIKDAIEKSGYTAEEVK